MDLSYILTELGEERSQYFNAVSPPIVQTSNFAINTVDELRKAFQSEMDGYLYSRGINPTVDILRTKLAALDEAEDCLVFNSGAAAIFAAVLANVKSGDHILSVRNPYSWAQHMFDVILPRFGVTTTYVDGQDINAFEKVLGPNTTLIYLESPNSWTYELQDLEAISALAKPRGIITVIDNSYCTPLYQQPIPLGIDISIQTATKYIGGHSDTLGGVVCGSAAMIKKIFNSEYLCIGSGLQPFNAWLLLRGLRTLPMRLERISSSTKAVLHFLKTHPKVDVVLFPLDESFPQYTLAKKQMKGASGLITFTLKEGTAECITRFCEALQHIMMAVSWGGYESLILPRMASLPLHQFQKSNIEHQYIRLYVGLEDSEYIIKDISRALETI